MNERPVGTTWLGHASVRVMCEGTEIYVDSRKINGTAQDATLAIVTHSHGDRYSLSDTATVRTPETVHRVYVRCSFWSGLIDDVRIYNRPVRP